MSHHLWGAMDARDLAAVRDETATSDYGRDVEDAPARGRIGATVLRYCQTCKAMRPKAGRRASDTKFVCPRHDYAV